MHVVECMKMFDCREKSVVCLIARRKLKFLQRYMFSLTAQYVWHVTTNEHLAGDLYVDCFTC